MHNLVRAKAWHVLLVIASPAALVCVWLGANLGRLNEIGFEAAIVVAALFVNLFAFIWIWSIGHEIHRLNVANEPSIQERSYVRFTVASTYVLAFAVVFFIMAFFVKVSGEIESLFTLLSFFALVCMFYMVFYVSAAIAQTEKRRGLVSGTRTSGFLALWFFPIGIWFIQPRVNAIFDPDRSKPKE